MKLHEKLTAIFGVSIREGRYMQSLSQLDAMGAVTKRKQLDVLMALCESFDDMANQYEALGARLDELDKKYGTTNTKPDTKKPV